MIHDTDANVRSATSEAIVNSSIEAFTQEGRSCTSLIIAHRLHSVRNCDEILVFDAGRVIERGNHGQLLQIQNGTYAALYQLSQAGSAEAKADSEPATEGTKQQAQVHQDQGLVEEISVEIPQSESAPVKKIPLKRVFEFARQDKLWFIPGFGAAAVSGLIFPLFALIFAQIITTLYIPVNATLLQQCGTWALVFFGLACVHFVASIVQRYALGLINGRMTTRVRTATLRSILRADMGYFDNPKNNIGSLTSKIATDASMVKAVLSDRVSLTIENITTLVAGLTIAFVASWKVALVVLALFPIAVVGVVLQVS